MLEMPFGQQQMQEKELEKLKKTNKRLIIGIILIIIYLIAIIVYSVIDFKERENSSKAYWDKYRQQEIDEFNSKFESSAGSNVRGTVVKTLILTAISSNGNNEDSRQIYITTTNISVTGVTFSSDGTNDSNELSKLSNAINSSHRYTAELGYDVYGFVNKITITDNTSTDNDNITNDYINNINNTESLDKIVNTTN